MTVSNAKAAKQYTTENKENDMLKVNEKKVYLFSKRFLDIVLSLIGLIFLLPVFILVAIGIKIEDKNGPVFFSQTRVGKNQSEFTMYKFRSMVSNAEELLENLLEHNETTGAMFKMKNDPRVTRIGSFIRKTSIDELPQLINVLKGEMSLVGPRPPLKREVEVYTQYQKQRLLIQPGCTGLWQVSGRSNIGFEDMVELDLKYIVERSIFKDILIIIKTVLLVFNKNGAY
ncbi:exopolysaccharide biosynthesis polyprenyl glycosylphosphotransferase [Priestia megaterium]|uniref:sugar transferase n=1 Tax=Priestia megaterium TaxID=1404 RepID=UPI002FFEFE54